MQLMIDESLSDRQAVDRASSLSPDRLVISGNPIQGVENLDPVELCLNDGLQAVAGNVGAQFCALR